MEWLWQLNGTNPNDWINVGSNFISFLVDCIQGLLVFIVSIPGFIKSSLDIGSGLLPPFIMPFIVYAVFIALAVFVIKVLVSVVSWVLDQIPFTG